MPRVSHGEATERAYKAGLRGEDAPRHLFRLFPDAEFSYLDGLADGGHHLDDDVLDEVGGPAPAEEPAAPAEPGPIDTSTEPLEPLAPAPYRTRSGETLVGSAATMGRQGASGLGGLLSGRGPGRGKGAVTRFALGMVLYAVGLQMLKNGPGAGWAWVKAKFVNDTGTGAAGGSTASTSPQATDLLAIEAYSSAQAALAPAAPLAPGQPGNYGPGGAQAGALAPVPAGTVAA